MPFIRRHPFLLLGLLTLTWFFAVEALNRAGHTQAVAAAAAPLRVLIVPMYVVWLPFTMLNAALAGPGGVPSVVAPLIWICGLAAGLTPYVWATICSRAGAGGAAIATLPPNVRWNCRSDRHQVVCLSSWS